MLLRIAQGYRGQIALRSTFFDLKTIAKADVEEVQVPGRARVNIEGRCHHFVAIAKPCQPRVSFQPPRECTTSQQQE
jgi:hypothetical protein